MEEMYDHEKFVVKKIKESGYNLDALMDLISGYEPEFLQKVTEWVFFEFTLMATKSEIIDKDLIPVELNENLYFLRELRECFCSMHKDAHNGRISLKI